MIAFSDNIKIKLYFIFLWLLIYGTNVIQDINFWRLGSPNQRYRIAHDAFYFEGVKSIKFDVMQNIYNGN